MPLWSIKPWIGKTVDVHCMDGTTLRGDLIEPDSGDGWLVIRSAQVGVEIAVQRTAIRSVQLHDVVEREEVTVS